MASKSTENHWKCKCGNFLTNEVDNLVVKFRAINKQKTNVDYLRITATCNKCGLISEKEGVLVDDLKKLKKILELQRKSNRDIIEFLDNPSHENRKRVLTNITEGI